MLPQGRGACQRANRSPLHVGGRDERALPGPVLAYLGPVCTASVPKAASPSPHATRLPLFFRQTDFEMCRCALVAGLAMNRFVQGSTVEGGDKDVNRPDFSRLSGWCEGVDHWIRNDACVSIIETEVVVVG